MTPFERLNQYSMADGNNTRIDVQAIIEDLVLACKIGINVGVVMEETALAELHKAIDEVWKEMQVGVKMTNTN